MSTAGLNLSIFYAACKSNITILINSRNLFFGVGGDGPMKAEATAKTVSRVKSFSLNSKKRKIEKKDHCLQKK